VNLRSGISLGPQLCMLRWYTPEVCDFPDVFLSPLLPDCIELTAFLAS
jgi:hypothetical protein